MTQDPRSLPQIMPSLPTELFRPIIDMITYQPTIYALLFVSSIFNYEAERVLYRRISLIKGREIQEKLYQRLQSCERVAKLVLDLHISTSFKIAMTDPVYWPSLSLALRSCINLKTLIIRNTLADFPMAHILDGCLFQLENFSWPYSSEDKLLHFLENQPQIRKLILFWQPSEIHISPNALPRLLMLGANANVINTLLPGRKVTHLYWDPDLDDEPDLARIGPALNGIRVPKYGNVLSAPPLHTIIDYLGNLEVFEWNQPKHHQEIIDNAPLFRKLRKVILPFTEFMPADPKKLVKILFAFIPTLCSVDLGLEKGAFRWSRDSAEWEPIRMQFRDWMFY